MKRRFGKLEVDLSPPNEAQKQVEAELRAFRKLVGVRKAQAKQTKSAATPKGRKGGHEARPSKATRK